MSLRQERELENRKWNQGLEMKTGDLIEEIWGKCKFDFIDNFVVSIKISLWW